jgi:hypothetical protein
VKASGKNTACGSNAESDTVGSASGRARCDGECAVEAEAGTAQCPRHGGAARSEVETEPITTRQE